MPLELYYLPGDPGHTWAKIEDDGMVRVGVDDFMVKTAGKIQFVRLSTAGKALKQSQSFGTIESTKWIGRLAAPVAGTIKTVNEAILKKPTILNDDPYEAGWMIVIYPSSLEDDLKNLLKEDAAIDWLKKEIRYKAKEEV